MNESDLIEHLAERLKSTAEVEEADAAVCLLLRLENHLIKALFVKRAETPDDPWSGQMALPGGKRDPRDPNLRETAVRETFEETAIDLHHIGHFLGALEPKRSTQRPEMQVTTFIVLLDQAPVIRLNEELERFVWISIQDLKSSRGFTTINARSFPAYVIGNDVIWGLTYRIMETVFDTLKD